MDRKNVWNLSAWPQPYQYSEVLNIITTCLFITLRGPTRKIREAQVQIPLLPLGSFVAVDQLPNLFEPQLLVIIPALEGSGEI